MMVQQNKWRAARFGTAAQLVDSYTHETQPVDRTVEKLTGQLATVAAELGCEHHLEQCRQIASSPSWADRQLSILAETNSPEEVVRQLTNISRITPVAK